MVFIVFSWQTAHRNRLVATIIAYRASPGPATARRPGFLSAAPQVAKHPGGGGMVWCSAEIHKGFLGMLRQLMIVEGVQHPKLRVMGADVTQP